MPLDRSPTFVFDVDEIEENPLNMKGIYHTLPSMLGVNQWEDIIRIFNEKETLSDVAIQNFRKANIANLVKDSLIASDLFIPRIHPLLQTIVPASIEDFAIQFPEQLEHLTGEPSLMIVTKYHGQYVRLHYIGGTLYQADYVCP
ncbi:MAG: hypothetical protein H6766_00135 [Candidatus Peribacteria bacterium]|nr:MAG: hypothetical protein H6766_00135 [Candidatus Peribacteria bacterium]